MPVNTEGFCECGCGERTRPAPYTHSGMGWIKGRPVRFIQGHNARGKLNPAWQGGKTRHSKGYVERHAPDHPRANRGRVLEHILVAEEALGKPLPEGAEVHHVNGDRKDNRNRNLVICEDRAYHMLLEQRTRALKACGHADWLKCKICKQWDDPTSPDLYTYPRKGRASLSVYHRSCGRERSRRRRRRR